MSFILFVLSWFLPYAIYRMDEQRAEKGRNAQLRLGRIEKKTFARERNAKAKRSAAIQGGVVMVMIELLFLYFLDSGTDGLAEALGVATGAFVVAFICMFEFEKSANRTLDKKETDDALAEGRTPRSREFTKDNGFYLEPEPTLHSGNGHGSAKIESAEQSGLIDDDAMAPVKKGGR